MVKLNEKQMNYAVIGIGVLFLLISLVLAYLDYEEKGMIEQEQKKVSDEINALVKLENEVKQKRKDLYVLKGNFETFKDLLPDDRKVGEFYVTLDKFRLEQKMDAWKSFAVDANEQKK